VGDTYRLCIGARREHRVRRPPLARARPTHRNRTEHPNGAI
jgi:hypothetical protein